MKKVFIVLASILMAGVVAIIITINCMKKNVAIEHDAPYTIRVYNKSTNPNNNTGYKAETAEYSIINEKVNNITNMSYYDRLLKFKTLDTKLELSTDGTYVKWTSDLKSKNLVIEFEFEEEQDLVVYDNGNTRVISYYCISYVINKTNTAADVAVYYSTTRDSTTREESYAKCDPIILKGYTGDIISYIDSLNTSD